MLGVQLAALLDGAPPGVDEALDLITGLDDTLVHGLTRLGEAHAASLTALAAALSATPLATPVREAVDKVIAGSITDEHLAALAGARTAVFGAIHDALLSQFDTALTRPRTTWPAEPTEPTAEPTPAPTSMRATRPTTAPVEPTIEAIPASPLDSATTPATQPPPEPSTVPGHLLAGCRSWLKELAIAGWRGVDHDLVSASDQTVEALLSDMRLRGLAVLLDGLAAELRASCPVATLERLPVRRWSDLWARGTLLAQAGDGSGAASPVSGRLLLLGVDVHEHATAVQFQVHAILEPTGAAGPRLVRVSVAAAKVDTIVGAAVWRLLLRHPVLLAALAGRRSLEIEDMPLLAGGDLVWHDDRAAAGEPADPFATARVLLTAATAPPVLPLDRHPVRIAEPVLVEGYRPGEGFELDGHTLPVDLDRLPSCGPLTPGLVAASSRCIGLIRWDAGRWSLQPLAVQGTRARKPFEAHNGDWAMGPTDPKVVKAEARAGDAVAVLRERAGRLLRR